MIYSKCARFSNTLHPVGILWVLRCQPGPRHFGQTLALTKKAVGFFNVQTEQTGAWVFRCHSGCSRISSMERERGNREIPYHNECCPCVIKNLSSGSVCLKCEGDKSYHCLLVDTFKPIACWHLSRSMHHVAT